MATPDVELSSSLGLDPGSLCLPHLLSRGLESDVRENQAVRSHGQILQKRDREIAYPQHPLGVDEPDIIIRRVIFGVHSGVEKEHGPLAQVETGLITASQQTLAQTEAQ